MGETDPNINMRPMAYEFERLETRSISEYVYIYIDIDIDLDIDIDIYVSSISNCNTLYK